MAYVSRSRYGLHVFKIKKSVHACSLSIFKSHNPQFFRTQTNNYNKRVDLPNNTKMTSKTAKTTIISSQASMVKSVVHLLTNVFLEKEHKKMSNYLQTESHFLNKRNKKLVTVKLKICLGLEKN